MFYKSWIICIVEIMLNEVCVYVKHGSVWNMMNECVIMFISQYYENGDYVKDVLTSTHTHFEWMNEVNECEWGIVGWILFLIRAKVSRQSLLSP